MKHLMRRVLAVALLVPLAGWAAQSAPLFERLGGDAAVRAIASDLIDASSNDPQTARSFRQKVDIPRLKRLLAEQLCAVSDGPCKFSGDGMREVHAGLAISEAEFYRMVEHLIDVLHRRGIGERETNQLLARLAPMKRDIVEVGNARP